MEDSFSTNQGQRAWFGDDSSAVGFELLWGSNATVDLTGEAAQMVMQAVGSGCKYGWSFTGSPATHLPFNLVLRPQTSTGPWPRGWGPGVKPRASLHKTSFSDTERGTELQQRSPPLSGPNSTSLSSRAWATQSYYTQISSATGKKSLSQPLKGILFKPKGKFLQPSISCQLIW